MVCVYFAVDCCLASTQCACQFACGQHSVTVRVPLLGLPVYAFPCLLELLQHTVWTAIVVHESIHADQASCNISCIYNQADPVHKQAFLWRLACLPPYLEPFFTYLELFMTLSFDALQRRQGTVRFKSKAGGEQTREALLETKTHRRVNRRHVSHHR